MQDWIRNGVVRPGDRLPTELDLSDRFNVSRVTVRRALDLLENDALVKRSRKRGTFIAKDAVLPPVVSPLSQHARQIGELSKGVSSRYLGSASVAADKMVAEGLDLSESDSVREIQFLRLVNQEPLAYVVIRLPPGIADLISFPKPEAAFPLVRMLTSRGVKAARVKRAIGAQNADLSLAEHLNIEPGAAVVRVTSIESDAEQHPFKYTTSYFRADIYEYDIEFIEDSDEYRRTP